MSIFTTIKEKVMESLDVHIKMLKLNAIGVTSKLVSYILFAFICLFIGFTVVVFLGLGITEGFVAMGLSRVASSFLTVGVLILLMAIIIACRKGITDFFASGVITALTADGEDDNKEKE